MRKSKRPRQSGEVNPSILLLVLVLLAGAAYWYYQKSAAPPEDESATASESSAAPEFAAPAEAQREAVRRYPELGVGGSRLNRAFIARHKVYQQQQPEFLRNPSWPLLLADEVVKTLPAAEPGVPKPNGQPPGEPKPKSGDWMWEKRTLDPKSKLE